MWMKCTCFVSLVSLVSLISLVAGTSLYTGVKIRLLIRVTKKTKRLLHPGFKVVHLPCWNRRYFRILLHPHCVVATPSCGGGRWRFSRGRFHRRMVLPEHVRSALRPAGRLAAPDRVRDRSR